MSLGGLTAIGLGAVAPQLIRELVLVDVTPAAMHRHAELTAAQKGTVAALVFRPGPGAGGLPQCRWLPLV